MSQNAVIVASFVSQYGFFITTYHAEQKDQLPSEVDGRESLHETIGRRDSAHVFVPNDVLRS